MLDVADSASCAAEPLSASVTGLDLHARPFSNTVGLRVSPASAGHLAAAHALGLDLGAAVNRATEARGCVALRLGPDEWLIDTGAAESERVVAALRGALEGQHAAVVDLSDGISAFDVRGSRAIDVLRKGCGIDLHPAVFTPCCVSRTTLAQATVVLRCVGGPEAWRLYVDRSYAAYMWAWLCDAGREFLDAGARSQSGPDVPFKDTSV